MDVVDWGRNPAAPESGRFAMLRVRYGKAVRGQPPPRRNVLSVMGWAVKAVADYVDNIRPRVGCEEHGACWLDPSWTGAATRCVMCRLQSPECGPITTIDSMQRVSPGDTRRLGMSPILNRSEYEPLAAAWAAQEVR